MPSSPAPLRGFSVLEMLLAMSILVLVFGATLMLSFGNQTAVVDSQTTAEALNITQELLEKSQAAARKDFNLVNPYATTSPDGFYSSSVDVSLSDDYLVKTVTATTSWAGEHGRARSVTLTSLVTNFDNAVGANTCNSTVQGNWSAPTLLNSEIDFASLAGVSGTYSITDVDAFQGRLYVTTTNGSSPVNQPTFFIFDIETPSSPTLLGSIDTDTGNATGLYGVSVTKSSLGEYAYVANASGILAGQLQILDVENPGAISIKSSLAVPGILSGAGNTLFYKDGQVFLGLTATAGAEKELNIIDVRNPSAPALRESFGNNNHDINAIFVSDNYAFIASPDTEQLKVIDVGDLENPTLADTFDGPGGNGKAVYVVGDEVYLGVTEPSARFVKLDASTPTNLIDINITKSFSKSVDGIMVRDSLAFVLTKTSLEIVNATSTATFGSATLSGAGAGAPIEPSFDCEGNYVYVAANSSFGNGRLYVFGPSSP